MSAASSVEVSGDSSVDGEGMVQLGTTDQPFYGSNDFLKTQVDRVSYGHNPHGLNVLTEDPQITALLSTVHSRTSPSPGCSFAVA